MIPRYQKILFWTLLGCAILMAIVLIRLRERAHDRLIAEADSVPLTSADASTQDATLLLGNDADGSLTPVHRDLPLPDEANARARVLLTHLLAEYASPNSTHPIAGQQADGSNAGATGIEGVFLMPLPKPAPPPGGFGDAPAGDPGQMAIVNLSQGFVENHPSGIEAETLTLLSIIGTLHANLPQIRQVRFLVDGQPRDTLAGHADLSRVYLAAGPAEDSPAVHTEVKNQP